MMSSTTVGAIATTEIYGDQGTILQDHGDGVSTANHPENAVALRMIRKGDPTWTNFDFSIPVSHGERLKNVPRPFIDYVRGLTDKTISAEDGRVTIEMVLGAYRSAAEGRRITLSV
jgi:predicted dehydrogenase